MSEKYKQLVLGIDYDKEEIRSQLLAKRNVILGDATDLEFWQRIPSNSNVRLIILATSNHPTHMQVTKQIRKNYKKVMIAGLSRYTDEIEELKQAGVQVVFNLYAEAGVGYAEQTYQFFNEKYNSNINPDNSDN